MSESALAAVRQYIEHQEEHHRKMSFQDDYRKILEKYRLPYEERFVWDGRSNITPLQGLDLLGLGDAPGYGILPIQGRRP